MDALTFEIPGPPVPQPRPKISTRGGHGRAYVEKKHPIHVYRQAVQLAATSAARWNGHKPTDGPVVLEVLAVFTRPPSHLNAAGEPRATAPAFPPRCDWDNLGKGVADAITDCGAIWLDDDQVVDGRVRKRYAKPGEAARTIVQVRPCHDAEA
jgi:Holliday junction resolvase RusA-like endonuclease